MTQPTVLVVMGVSGSGKTTLGSGLAEEWDADFLEGDDLHPPANRGKMAAGTPLTDDDRWPWLTLVRQRIEAAQSAGRTAVVTCSALRRAYRDRLRGPGVWFVLLHGPRAELERRMSRRTGHFMPIALLDSQLETLELPGEGEPDVVIVPIGGSPRQELERALQLLAEHGVCRSGVSG